MTKIGAHVSGHPRHTIEQFCRAKPAAILGLDDGGVLKEAKDWSNGHTWTFFRTTEVYGERPADLHNPPGTYQQMANYWYFEATPSLKEKYDLNPADCYIPNNEITGGENPDNPDEIRQNIKNQIAYERPLMKMMNADGKRMGVLALAGGSPGSFSLWAELCVPFIKEAFDAGNFYVRHAYEGNWHRVYQEAQYLLDNGLGYGGMFVTEWGFDGGYGQKHDVEKIQEEDAILQAFPNIPAFLLWEYGKTKFDANIDGIVPELIPYMEAHPSNKWQPGQPPSSDPRSVVCDVSRHQNRKDASDKVIAPINFAKMETQGAEGCYIRGSIGGRGLDDAFALNWEAILGTTMVRGMYHLFNTTSTARDQLDNIKEVVSQYKHGDMRIAFDVEPLKDSNGNRIRINGNRVSELIALFKNEFQYDPLIYTGLWVLSYVDGDKSWINTELLWLASYWSRPPKVGEYPRLPTGVPLDHLLMHQWTSSYYDGRDWGVASAGLDVNFAYDLNRLLVDYKPPPPPDDSRTFVVALLPEEADEDYWSELARHAYRDHKRDITGWPNVAEAIYLAGDDKSYIKIIDPEYASQKKAIAYFQEQGYRIELVPFQPPPPPPPPPTERVDIFSYMRADPTAWRVVRHPSGHQEDVQDMSLGNGLWVRRKNQEGEWWKIVGGLAYLLHDTSPAPQSGITRVYTLYKNEMVGAPKNPRYLALGEKWVEDGTHMVRFRAKQGCQHLSENSGPAQNSCQLIRYFGDGYEFNQYGQHLRVDSAIWLQTGQETQIYAKKDGKSIGWVGGYSPWWESELVEVHWNRGILTKEPNRFCSW